MRSVDEYRISSCSRGFRSMSMPLSQVQAYELFTARMTKRALCR
jgi:hypothetical protein